MASQRTVHVRGFGREKRDVRVAVGGEKGRREGSLGRMFYAPSLHPLPCDLP